MLNTQVAGGAFGNWPWGNGTTVSRPVNTTVSRPDSGVVPYATIVTPPIRAGHMMSVGRIRTLAQTMRGRVTIGPSKPPVQVPLEPGISVPWAVIQRLALLDAQKRRRLTPRERAILLRAEKLGYIRRAAGQQIIPPSTEANVPPTLIDGMAMNPGASSASVEELAQTEANAAQADGAVEDQPGMGMGKKLAIGAVIAFVVWKFVL